jgi:hypothetical protein
VGVGACGDHLGDVLQVRRAALVTSGGSDLLLVQRGELADHQPEHEQECSGDDVDPAVDAQVEVRLGVEEVEGECGGDRGQHTGGAPAEDRRDHDHDGEDQCDVARAEPVAERDEEGGDADRGARPEPAGEARRFVGDARLGRVEFGHALDRAGTHRGLEGP